MALQKHLKRLDRVWIEPPIFFVTICASERRPTLANRQTYEILRAHLGVAAERTGWRVGRFVVMPDHVHLFCVGDGTQTAKPLSRFIAGFKQWSAKALIGALGFAAPVWQKQFFDHLLRSGESYEGKWRYVVENPVRAGLVRNAEDWPYAGELAQL